MENSVVCPQCHTAVKPTDYFCYNCGKNLKGKPPDTSAARQILVYLESFFLLPIGIIIGMRYLKQKDQKSKIVGYAVIVQTIVSIVVFTIATIGLIDYINNQVAGSMQQFEGF